MNGISRCKPHFLNHHPPKHDTTSLLKGGLSTIHQYGQLTDEALIGQLDKLYKKDIYQDPLLNHAPPPSPQMETIGLLSISLLNRLDAATGQQQQNLASLIKTSYFWKNPIDSPMISLIRNLLQVACPGLR